MEKKVSIQTTAVHAGDRKKPSDYTSSTTPIHLSSTFFYDTTDQLDRVFGHELEGESYSRYGNPTNAALEEVIAELEGAPGSLACSSGMMAIQVALTAALLDRRKSILAASALYGATINMLLKIFEPFGVEINFVDICNLDAVKGAIADHKPGAVLLETISNPLMRVAEIDRIAGLCRDAGAALVVDNTFASPLLVRPLELGAHLVVHSVTKYLSGHGDVLGGAVVCDTEHLEAVRGLARISGPLLGPFECYLAMRGIKTFPLRMERQCENAARIAQHLLSHPKVDAVYYPGHPQHPDGAAVRRLFPERLRGAILSFEVKGAVKQDVFRWMDGLKTIVRGTSLGDVHTLALYPLISSHRDLPPKQRERMGIRDNLVRISAGIEGVDDIIEDLERGFAAL